MRTVSTGLLTCAIFERINHGHRHLVIPIIIISQAVLVVLKIGEKVEIICLFGNNERSSHQVKIRLQNQQIVRNGWSSF